MALYEDINLKQQRIHYRETTAINTRSRNKAESNEINMASTETGEQAKVDERITEIGDQGSNHWSEFTKRQRTLKSLPQRNDIKADFHFNKGSVLEFL